MKQIKIITVFLIVLMFIGCGREKINSFRTENPIKVDGSSGDWDSEKLIYNEDLKIVYSVSNDDKNINIIIRFQDRSFARKILSNGLTIWFDEDKEDGIQFIDYDARDQMIENMMKGMGAKKPGQMNYKSNFANGWQNGSFYLITNKIPELLKSETEQSFIAAAGIIIGRFVLKIHYSSTGAAAGGRFHWSIVF